MSSHPNIVDSADDLRRMLTLARTIAVLGITSDRIGWTRVADQTDSYFDPASLALDTYMIEYRTGSGSGFNFVQAGGAILLHYKVSGTVPEPASAGMLIAGALLLRALRRRKG